MRTLIAAAALWLVAFTPGAFADPLHKYGSRGAWRHADSGWIFPKQMGAFTRAGEPYTIDGNNDVGAEFVAGEAGGTQRRALVSVYFPDSAAAGADLSSAKAALLKGHQQGSAEQPFEIPRTPEVKGVRLTAAGDAVPGGSRSILYFFSAPSWIVTVVATVPAPDTGNDVFMDEFVRSLPWETLGVYDDNMHGGGPRR
jgi:hypothetical protein